MIAPLANYMLGELGPVTISTPRSCSFWYRLETHMHEDSRSKRPNGAQRNAVAVVSSPQNSFTGVARLFIQAKSRADRSLLENILP